MREARRNNEKRGRGKEEIMNLDQTTVYNPGTALLLLLLHLPPASASDEVFFYRLRLHPSSSSLSPLP